MRKILIGLLGIALLATACSSGPKGAQTYQAAMDAPSPTGKNFQVSAFFPSAISVRPGDSIVFNNKSSQAPHTLSFGIDDKRSNQPAPVIPGKGENPAVLLPCVTAAAPTPTLQKCPTKAPKTLPAYDGKGYWNSGFLVPTGAPAGVHQVTLKLGDSIAPGTYHYVCILHRTMSGVITVVAKDSDRTAPKEVTKAAIRAAVSTIDDANKIPPPATGLSGTTFNAAAGWSNAVTAVNRFSPSVISVKRGMTVSWTAKSAFEPHTVTFGPGQKAASEDLAGFAPAGVKSGNAYTGGLAGSGIFGAAGGQFPPGPFSLRFTQAGTYTYVCILHPNMMGTVKVT